MKCNNDDSVVKELYHSNFKGWERKEIDFIKELTTKKNMTIFLILVHILDFIHY